MCSKKVNLHLFFKRDANESIKPISVCLPICVYIFKRMLVCLRLPVFMQMCMCEFEAGVFVICNQLMFWNCEVRFSRLLTGICNPIPSVLAAWMTVRRAETHYGCKTLWSFHPVYRSMQQPIGYSKATVGNLLQLLVNYFFRLTYRRIFSEVFCYASPTTVLNCLA